MIALTRKTDYAVVALAELAQRAPATVSSRTLAKETGIALPVLSVVLNSLVRGDLVVSVRGSLGGYRLAKSAEAIRLVDIIEAVDGPPRLTQCCSMEVHAEAEDEPCDLEGSCRIMGPMQRVHRGLREFMSQISLSQIAFEFVPMRIELSNSARRGGAAGSMGEIVV